jgi:uncharacterized protein YaiE (UPF0345 family)/uncharacterized protein YpmB
MKIEKGKIFYANKIIFTIIIVMIFMAAFTVFTVRPTEVTNNGAPADYVKASETYVLVMNFTITTESDTVLNGTAPSDGQILEDSNQSDDWGDEGATQMLFYDATEDNEEWNSGEDCIFLDDGTADNEYTTGDSVLAGTAPDSGTIYTGFGCKNQTAWKRIKSYDAANGGPWDNATDAIILEGTDNNNCYMDELNTVVFNLSDTCNASGTDISDVTIWLETTGAGFSSTDDTFIGNGTFDGTNSTVISGLNQDINPSVTLYIAVNISGSATNGATIIMEIPSLYDVNSNGAYDLGDQGLFLAGTNDTGSIINAYAQTIDTSVPTVVIEYSTSVIYLKDADSVRIFANFSEGGAGITEFPQISINYSGGTDLDATNMVQSDNLHWYYDLNVPSGGSYDGQFTVNVSATDNASNALNPDPSIDNSKYIDNSAPTVTINIPQNNSYYNALATINGTASDSGSGIGTVNLAIYNQTSDKYWNGTDWEIGLNWSTATGYTSWTYDSTSITWINGSYYYVNVTSTDNISNVGIITSSNFTFDTYAPEISSISAGSITSSSATITWNTIENATSFVEYGPTTSYGSWSNSSTYTTSHSRDLTGLSQNTQYHYRVKSVDVANNSNTSTDKTFTTEIQYTPPSGPSNYAPTAEAGGPYSGYTNAAITFIGSGTDSDGTVVGYRWDWTNDGTYDTDWLTTNTTTHSYSSTGTYTVRLQVKDDDDATSSDTAVVIINESTVQLYAPLAKTNGPYSALTFENIVFDGTQSSDTDGTITNYTWNLGDGTTAYGVTVTHSYNASGLILITLTIKDNDGLINGSVTTANITLDSDADGWSDELEESYGMNANDSDSTPADNDGDGIPDEDSLDGKYIGDNDDDNDGIDDETEIDLGSNPNDSFDVKNITLDETLCYLIDTNSDGNLDTFYDPSTQKNTVLKFEDGKYLIDTNGDGEYNYIYDPASGEVSEYTKEEPKGEFPWLILIIIAIVLIIILIITMLFKTGYLYLEDEHTEEEKTSKKHKKTNNKSSRSKK